MNARGSGPKEMRREDAKTRRKTRRRQVFSSSRLPSRFRVFAVNSSAEQAAMGFLAWVV